MSQQYPGGFITFSNLGVSLTKASGVWTLDQAMQYNKAGNWPGQSLYAFTTFTFTTATATGFFGPSLAQCKTVYNTATNPWLDNTAYFNVTGGIQLWTVPKTGVYTIDAYGSGGGLGGANAGTAGTGARIKGDFTLTAGQKLRILVGQPGNTTSAYGAGGGGGTFVIKETGSTAADIFVIAGGGGGPGYSTGLNGVAAVITSNGTAASDGTGSGGTGGSGGSGGTEANYPGGGGGGFTGNGGTSGTGTSPGGFSFTNGGEGGIGAQASYKGNGGFGGGGSSSVCGGGGGGYSGGGAGSGSYTGGGGGGSYNNGTNQTNTAGGTAAGVAGKVIITFVA